MTAFFVRKFNKENQCQHCKDSALTVGGVVYSLCSKHLASAREKFTQWSKARRNEGLCVRCDCKSFRGYLRCRKHTKKNREDHAAWTKRQIALNPNYYNDRWNQRKAKADAAGLCRGCFGPKSAGFMSCDRCRARVRANPNYKEARIGKR